MARARTMVIARDEGGSSDTDTTDRPAGRLEDGAIERLTVPELARLCTREMERYRRREPHLDRFGFELFRRAIVERNDAAWAALYAQYAETVRWWLGLTVDEDDELVTLTFERFWRAMDAVKFSSFSGLGGVLAYLKSCAQTARLDRARAVSVRAREEPLDAVATLLPARDDTEGMVAAHIDRVAFWHMVRQYLADEREHSVLYLSYVVGLSPRQIYARHAARFDDIAEVYRIKRAVIARLRRAPSIVEQLP
jgi:hypothetical protein